MLVAVTDHAAERYRQRVAGTLDPKRDVARRVGAAVQAGRISGDAPDGIRGRRGGAYVRDLDDRALIYVCRRNGGELIVVTLWERPGTPAAPRVPKRFTDAADRGR